MLMLLNNKYEVAVSHFTKEYITNQGIMNMRADLEISDNLSETVNVLLQCAKAKEIIESIQIYHNDNLVYDLHGTYGLQDLTEHVSPDGVSVTLNFSEL